MADDARRTSGRLRVILRPVGPVWRLELTRAGRRQFTRILDGVTVTSSIRLVHDAADSVLTERRPVAAHRWRQVGTAWTTEFGASPSYGRDLNDSNGMDAGTGR